MITPRAGVEHGLKGLLAQCLKPVKRDDHRRDDFKAFLWVTSVTLSQELTHFKIMFINHLRNRYLCVSLFKLCVKVPLLKSLDVVAR